MTLAVERDEGGVPSPCTKVCEMDPQTGWCLGCHRTLEEIACWPHWSNAQKARVLEALERRRRAAR